MITVNIFHSAVKDDFTTHGFEESKPIRELFPDIDFKNAVIGVNGIWEDENKAPLTAGYVLRDGDLCTIRLFPEGGDGDWMSSLMTGFTMTSAAAIRITSTVGAGIVNPFRSGSETADLKSPSQIEGIPQLRGAKNQSAADKPIPIVLGRHLFSPAYIGKPYTSIDGIDGEDQYFHCLYLLGYSKLKVTNIQLGPIHALSTAGNSGGDGSLPLDASSVFADSVPELELWQGPNPERDDGEVGLYPQKVTEEQVGNIELSHTAARDDMPEETLRVDRFTDKNPMKVQIEFLFPGGLVKYDDEVNKTNASVGIKVLWRKGQDDNWKPFGRIGTDGGGHSPTDYDSSTGITTITRAKNKVMRFVAEHTFHWEDISGVPSRALELHIERTSAQATDTKTSDKVYLAAIRTWSFDYDKSEKAHTLIPQVPMVPHYRDMTCRLGFKIKATNNLNGVIDSLNCIVQSYARTWNGSSWESTETPTSNPAGIALKVLQSPSLGSDAYVDQTGKSGYLPAWCRPRTRYDKNGQPYTIPEDRESMLDLDSFGEFYEWCEEREYYANGVLTSEKRVDEVLSAVLSTGRAMRVLNGSQYAVLIDKPRLVPATILNNKNILEVNNQKAFEDIPDGFSVKFIDEANGFQEAEGYVMRQNAAYPSGYDGGVLPAEYADSSIEKMEMPWVTNWRQVVKNARYLLKCRYIRTETWSRKVSIDGYLIGIGSLVDIQDDTIVVGIGDGADITGFDLNAGGSITGIHTNGIFSISDTSKRYGLKIMQFDGEHTPQARVVEVLLPGPGHYSNFTLAGPIAAADALKPSAGDVLSFGILDKITIQALCFGKKNSGDGKFDLIFSPYDESIYDDSGVVRELDAKITTPQSTANIPSLPSDTVTRGEAIEIAQNFNIPGPPGTPATIYELIPSATVIKRNNTGVIDPPAISCIQQSVTGGSAPEPSNKTLKYITSGGTETAYTGNPVTVGTWDWIEFRLYDGSTLLDRENVPVLSDGPPAVAYHLVPSVPMAVRDPSGEAHPSTISCSQQVVVGSKPPEPANKTIKYITSAGQTETAYTDPVPVAWDWIEFRLYDGDTLLDQERVFVLSEGEPARTYELQPGASVIRVYDGIIDPYTISCAQVSITGSGLPVPADKTIKYAASLEEERIYEKEIAVNPAWEWIEFRLYDGDVLLDKERIPVLKDGEAPIYLDLANQHITVRADEDGNAYDLPVTTQATLYNGNTPVTTAAFRAKAAEKDMVRYPGNLFDPMLGGFYPVRFRQWSISRGTIDQNGSITIYDLPEDEEEITVRAFYDNVEYTAALTIIKAKDAENPVIIDIENENTSIACDVYGDPYPGELPLQTKAVLYWGTQLVSPFWFLEGGRGITIAQDGTITVAQNAELAEVNNVLIKAAFKGQTYTRMFTLTKTRDGESPITLDILPDNEVIQCDYLGTPLRGLPLTARAALYKGTQEITAAMELGEAAKVDILHYPGNLFDPMLDGFYPALGYPVVWTLAGAPAGVTIDRYGLIAVSGTAQLSDINEITVRAAYHGRTFEAVFGITKARGGAPGTPGNAGARGDSALVPKYRGVATTADTGNTGKVTLKLGGEITANVGDWVAYLGTTINSWENGYCMRWDGTSWQAIPIEANGNFETNPYVAALMDLTEGAPHGRFMSILVRDLIAKTAMIEEIRVQLLKVGNAIFGGPRFGDDGVDQGNGKIGFRLDKDGLLNASNVNISGDSLFMGDIIAGPLKCLSEQPVGSTITLPKDRTAKDIYYNSSIYRDASAIGTYHNKNIVGARNNFSIELEDTEYYNYQYYSILKNIYAFILTYTDSTEETVAYFTERWRVRTGQYTTLTNNPLDAALTFTYANPNAKTLRFDNLPDGDPHDFGVVYFDRSDHCCPV